MAKKESRQFYTDMEALFDRHMQGESDDVRSGVLVYRTRTIKSGDMLECITYPVYVQKNRVRAAREYVTKEAQQNVNRRNAVRRVERLVHANFGKNALIVTCTYRQAVTEEEGAHQLDLYLQRLRRTAKKQGTDLKYICVTEVSSTGRVHHHMILEGIDRETAEKKWAKGFSNARSYQRNDRQFVGIVRYMMKYRSTQDAAAAGRRVRCSLGLKRPEERVSDHNISIRKMERIAEECSVQGIAVLQKAYPGYVTETQPEVRRSDYLPGAYMYARMWRADSAL